ncbi:hypothetical protein PISMIDRAFT_686942 [Pisolithus microcarpus 441]|uniref:G domain-containing protein n=1 Tax=Pisolithus microcarpus 441 TaxID=765257 RepID=A0A0C9YGR5_9AGAM|nr:hypothetical protein PISMIDRAFT_686942 [Pisolithus microcarpus 441]
MAPRCFSRFCCWQQPPSPGDDRTVSPVPARTGATRPDSGSPSDNRGIHGATAVETNRPGAPLGPRHVEVLVPASTQGSLPTGILTPALTDVQPTGPNCPKGSVDVPIHAQAEEVPPGSPSSRPPYHLDPVKAKKHINHIRCFCILVMGRANAGKTTILQRVCNTTDNPEIFNGKGEKVDAAVVHGSLTHGHHNIEDELRFLSNPGFVFHDSCGFESRSEEQFDLMKKFVRDRAKTTQLDERIHAIWFCIPLNESHRMVMAAERKFFDECDTGHVPVIVLLTKADTLSLEAVEELMGQGMSVDDAMKGAVKVEERMLHDCLERVKGWLNEMSFPPKDHLSLAGQCVISYFMADCMTSHCRNATRGSQVYTPTNTHSKCFEGGRIATAPHINTTVQLGAVYGICYNEDIEGVHERAGLQDPTCKSCILHVNLVSFCKQC